MESKHCWCWEMSVPPEVTTLDPLSSSHPGSGRLGALKAKNWPWKGRRRPKRPVVLILPIGVAPMPLIAKAERKKALAEARRVRSEDRLDRGCALIGFEIDERTLGALIQKAPVLGQDKAGNAVHFRERDA